MGIPEKSVGPKIPGNVREKDFSENSRESREPYEVGLL